jgi:hypothetical protein
MKHKLFSIVFIGLFILGIVPAILCAQSAATMDTILDQDMLSFGAASYLLLAARGDIDDDTDFEQAAGMMAKAQPLFSDKGAEETLDLGEFSFLLMEVYDLGGGLMYSILPSPRYAVRELAFLKIVQGSSYPNSALTGERAVRILERYLTVSGRMGSGGEA